MEYPKMLYRSGWDDLDDCVTVDDANQESDANAKGFVSLGSPEDGEKSAKPRRGRPRKEAE